MMEKILLIIVFTSGLYVSIENWKFCLQSLLELIEILKRGYNPADYPDCSCDDCKNENEIERLNHKIENYKADVSLIKKSLIDIVAGSIFSTGMTALILKIILIN